MRTLFWLGLCVAIVTNCSAQDTDNHTNAILVPETEMATRLSKMVAPTLPQGAIGKCSNAMVMLKITVDEEGRVSAADYLSGFDVLKDSTMTAIKQWTYKPYEQHGHPITVQTRVSIFYLGDGQSFPMYAPDGKGGVKGGNAIPLPPGCGPGPLIKRTQS